MTHKSASKTGDLGEWYASQYRASLNLEDLEGRKKYQEFLSSCPAVSNLAGSVPASGRQRVMGPFLRVKLGYPLSADGYICAVLSARLGGLFAHYGYAYWRCGTVGMPEYVCVSPTFESRDGEFRGSFMQGERFFSFCDTSSELIRPYEEAVINMLAGGLQLDSIVYPKSSAEEIATVIDSLRLPVLAFAIALAIDILPVRRGSQALHTHRAYVDLIQKISDDIPNAPEIISLRGLFSNRINEPRCGQKLMPMTLKEVMQPGDLNFSAWREVAVAQVASDLTLNFLTPSLPIFGQWSYIEGVDRSLFENASMKDKYARGLTVEASASSLREARTQLEKAKTGFLVEELSAKVYESIEYAQSFLLTSSAAMMHVVEDVGLTLNSIPNISRLEATGEAKRPLLHYLNSFSSLDTAARHLFELAYAAHCLHAKTGVAHTDLHTNNMTIYPWGSIIDLSLPAEKIAPIYDDPVVAFIAGPRGEADTFVFPTSGDSACIIDFSRCILGPGFRPRLEEGQSPQFATNFYRDQTNRVVRALHRYAPEYVLAHQDEIKAAVIADFDSVFPVLCAVDFIAIGMNLGAMLENLRRVGRRPEDVAEFVVDARAVELASKLEEAGRDAFITGLHGLVKNRGRAGPAPFPGLAVLRKVFAEWLFPRWAAREPERLNTAELVDAYNFNNEVRFASRDYARYPPWARLDEIELHLGEYKLTDLFVRGVGPFLESLRPGARVDVIAEQLRAQQEKLDGRPVSTASSWIED